MWLEDEDEMRPYVGSVLEYDRTRGRVAQRQPLANNAAATNAAATSAAATNAAAKPSPTHFIAPAMNNQNWTRNMF